MVKSLERTCGARLAIASSTALATFPIQAPAITLRALPQDGSMFCALQPDISLFLSTMTVSRIAAVDFAAYRVKVVFPKFGEPVTAIVCFSAANISAPISSPLWICFDNRIITLSGVRIDAK